MKKAIIAVVIGLVIIGLLIAFGQVFTVRYVDVQFINSVGITDKADISEKANIGTNTNIFVLNENEVEAAVESAYDHHAIDVVDIVRQFPNKVVIKVEERIALFRISVQNGETEGYVYTDKNFQRTTVYPTAGTDRLVDVTGYVVQGDFNVSECFALRNLANAMIESGIREEAIPYAVRSIEFRETTIVVTLSVTDTEFVLKRDPRSVALEFKGLYEQYVNTDYSERDGKRFEA